MKWIAKLLNQLKGLTKAIVRYPLTEMCFLAMATIVGVSINGGENYEKLLLTYSVGAVLCAALQGLYERFFNKTVSRFILMAGGVILTVGYYLILRSAPELGMEIGIRTSVALFALFFAFIWVPVIRSRISFNESFMAVFKAFFHAVFYSAVLFGGICLVISAMDTLIINVNHKAYAHAANIIFVLFATLFFLSLIPVYPGESNKDMDAGKTFAHDEAINKAAFCPKFLEILISYIIIPITAVFTLILLLYIVRNIRGEFWTNNLLEPMLVSYAITIILIYILASRLENKFAVMFRKLFPKLLVPIVLFQIAASSISIRTMGITHPRYFVILFGVFAVGTGLVMSLMPVEKNGIIAAMLIGFSVVSIIPPVDAFTVSRVSQGNMLKSVLIKNGMLKNNSITPNSAIPDEDKKKIVSGVQYLSMMGYTHKITWLPEDFTVYEDFYDTFGFYEYDLPEKNNQSISVFLNQKEALDIAGYDVLVHSYSTSDENAEAKICDIENVGKNYVLQKAKAGEKDHIILLDEKNNEMIHLGLDEIFSRYRDYAVDKAEISKEEATFSAENDRARLTVVVQNININKSLNHTNYYADFYILVKFK
jgi:hypothetical protein